MTFTSEPIYRRGIVAPHSLLLRIVSYACSDVILLVSFTRYYPRSCATAHVARITPNIKRQLESDYQHPLVNVFGTLSQCVFLARMTVEGRVLPWIIIWGDIPGR